MPEKKARSTMQGARARMLKALAVEPQPASSLGIAAFPDAKFRSPQGAALAAGRLIRALRDDGLICAGSDRRYYLSGKGAAAAKEHG